MTIIRNPKYASIDKSMIDVELNHPEFGWIPFTATNTDVEIYGRVVFALANTAEYGPIAPYDGPTEEEIIKAKALEHQIRLIAEIDTAATNPLVWGSITPEQQQEWIAYRKALEEVPNQPGFPETITWPERPTPSN